MCFIYTHHTFIYRIYIAVQKCACTDVKSNEKSNNNSNSATVLDVEHSMICYSIDVHIQTQRILFVSLFGTSFWKTRFSVQWLFVLVADVIVIGISFSPTTCRDSICVSFWCQQSFVWLSASIEMFLSCQMAKTVIVNGYECISALLCCYFSLHVIHLFQTFSHWNRSDRHNYSSYENKTLLVCPVICIFYSQYKQQCECDNEQ